MILFWVLVILGIVYLVKHIGNRNKAKVQQETALDILKKRYAIGEINKEEFEEKKEDLI
jgi:putative membrane protein